MTVGNWNLNGHTTKIFLAIPLPMAVRVLPLMTMTGPPPFTTIRILAPGMKPISMSLLLSSLPPPISAILTVSPSGTFDSDLPDPT